MLTNEIPADVSSFLNARVETFEQLEALLLLYSERGQALTSESIASKLGIAKDDVVEALDHLQSIGLVRRHGDADDERYGFAPQNDELSNLIGRLATLNAERRVEVMKLMSTNAITRVRDAAIRTFADAFLLNGKNKCQFAAPWGHRFCRAWGQGSS